MRHPYGIWNPIRNAKRKRGQDNYETSLWDLKPVYLAILCRDDALWDIPMGFETSVLWKLAVCALNYETSLWDLKLTASVGSLSARYHYETSLWDLKRYRSVWVRRWVPLWDIPMGFETRFFWAKRILELHYETSLWDLKPFGASACHGDVLLWDIPMGFETHSFECPNKGLYHYETSLWDLKLPTVRT